MYICSNRFKNYYEIKCAIQINHNITRAQIGDFPLDPLEPRRAVMHSTNTYGFSMSSEKFKHTMIDNNSKSIETK